MNLFCKLLITIFIKEISHLLELLTSIAIILLRKYQQYMIYKVIKLYIILIHLLIYVIIISYIVDVLIRKYINNYILNKYQNIIN